MSDHHEAKQATPPETLLAELLDSRVPKSEREHAAKREIERLTAERDDLRRQLSEWLRENSPGGWIDDLRRQLAEAQKELHNLNWALGTEGYDQMATPEEQAEHEAAVRAHHDVLARLEEGKRAYEAMKQDARRYRWLRDTCPSADKAPDVWHALCQKPGTVDQLLNRVADLDTTIDSAMGASNE